MTEHEVLQAFYEEPLPRSEVDIARAIRDARRRTRLRSVTISLGVVAVLVVAAVTAPQWRALLPGTGTGVSAPVPPRDDLPEERQQARDALTRYDRALADAGGTTGFIPVGELTGQIGNWEPDQEANKAALSAGDLVSAAALPPAPQPTGTVTWDSGGTDSLPLLSADQTLAALMAAGSGNCAGCNPLTVTGARLSTVRIDTSRGLATVPAWEFTIAATSVRVTRVAIPATAIVTVKPPPWDATRPPAGLSIQSARTTATGRELTVTLVGAPDPASQLCGVDYTAEATESDHAVVVIIIEHPHAETPGAYVGCGLMGAERTASVTLARPLDGRAVLEVRQGLPVPVTIVS
jgi:hypothetical protein